MCACREGPSFVEEILDLLGERIVEILRHGKLALSRAKPSPFRSFFKWHQFGDGLPRLGNDDFFTHGNPFQEAGQVGFGLVDIDFHESSIAKSWTKSNSNQL